MTDITQMVEQHILAYESRQNHMDELLARARAQVGKGPEHAEARAPWTGSPESTAGSATSSMP
jgi:hypothetical protein